MTACESFAEDLTALAWGKLEGERLATVEAHLDACGACRAEVEALAAVRRTLAAAGGVRTSEGFHDLTMDKVRVSAKPARGKSAPQWSALAGGHAPRPALSVAARYARSRERDRLLAHLVRPRWRLGVLAGSAAAAAAFLLAARLWSLAVPDVPTYDPRVLAERHHGRSTVARYMERTGCAERRESRIDGAAIDVSGLIDDGQVILAAAADPSSLESCVVAFRVPDWERYRQTHEGGPAGPERARFETMASSRQLATVVDGQLVIPKSLLEQYVNSRDVILLRLAGRMEIWSRNGFRTYSTRPTITVDTSDMG